MHRFRVAPVAPAGIWIIAALFAPLFLNGCAKQAPATLRIGADNAPPYTSLAVDGSVKGLAVDVLTEAARRRGIRLIWVPIRNAGPDRALKSHMVEAWSALSRSPERDKYAHFTKPWIEATYCLVARKGSNASAGKPRIAVRDSPVARGLAARIFTHEQKIGEPSNIAVVESVCRNTADEGFLETRVLDTILLDRPRDCQDVALEVRYVSAAEAPVSIASIPSAAAVADAVRAEIPSLAADGTFAAALDRWAGASAGHTRSMLALHEAEQKGRFYLLSLGAVSFLGLMLAWQIYRVRAARCAAEKAQRAAMLSEQRFHAFMDNSPAPAFVKDKEGRMVYTNASLQKIWNVKLSDWRGKTDAELWPPEIAEQLRANDLKAMETGRALELIEHVPLPSGELREFLAVKFPFLTPSNELMIGGMSIDVTASRRAEEALRLSEERYRKVVELAGDIIYQTDVNGNFTFCNQAALRTLGYREEDVIGKSYLTLVHPQQRAATASFYGRQFVRRKPESYYEFRCLTHDGEERWLGQSVQLLMADGKPCGFQAIARDITERKLLERKLEWQAMHDPLTGLPNRRYLIQALEQSIEKASRRNAPLTACICDIDSFKRINDTYGHAAGDDVLQAFAKNLKESVRDSDLAGRIAGDEFCIVLPNTGFEHASLCIERMREQFEMLTFEANDVLFGASASFGLAAWRPGMVAKDLLAAADRALYAAKDKGRNCVAPAAVA